MCLKCWPMDTSKVATHRGIVGRVTAEILPTISEINDLFLLTVVSFNSADKHYITKSITCLDLYSELPFLTHSIQHDISPPFAAITPSTLALDSMEILSPAFFPLNLIY